MIVKDNHPILHRKLKCFFASPTLFEPVLRRARRVNSVREEWRCAVLWQALMCLPGIWTSPTSLRCSA